MWLFIPTPIADRQAYLKMERTYGAMFPEYDALQVVTGWEDDPVR